MKTNTEEFRIRTEQEADHRAVEELTREAFWNVYKPGCDEHFFVHIMRGHRDFIPELAFVITRGDEIAANIMYMKAWLDYDDGSSKEILAFGPISVHPAYQRRGLGKWLMSHSFAAAAELGYDCVVIFGNPENYVSSGFKSCSRYGVTLGDGLYPAALLVRELKEGALDGRHCVYRQSDVLELLDPEKAAEFDRQFPPKEAGWSAAQEKFYIYSHSVFR